MLQKLSSYALGFPMQKFLQAQRKVMVMAWIALAVLMFHAFLSWLLIFQVGLGLARVAITSNISWYIIDIS